MTDHCEAKLHAFRRTQDGVVVAFVIHPAEVPQALALDPLGTRYMLAFAAINDDETQRDPDAGTSGSRPPPSAAAVPPAEAQEAGAKNLAKSWAAREAYRNKSPGEKAVALASLLVENPAFQRWVGADVWPDPKGRADRMLKRWCGITSKSEFADNEAARIKLNEMRVEFEMAEQRIAEVRG